MIITSPSHKGFLWSLFYVPGTLTERRLPIEKLETAMSCIEKLHAGASATVVDSVTTTIQFVDGDVEFTQDEAGLLRDLLSSLTEASPSEYRIIREVRTLLAPLVALQAGEGEGS